MSKFVVLSAAEQVAEHLRGQLMRGTWTGKMPGSDRLAAELGVGPATVEAALGLLEREGLLVNQGRRRGRTIAETVAAGIRPRLRVGILLSEKSDRRRDYMVELEHELTEAGHRVSFAPRSMSGLGMHVGKIAAMAEGLGADAWVVVAGSRPVLERFAESGIPVFALFGRRQGLSIAGAGPDKTGAIAEAVRTLVGLGHRRIVLLTRERQRVPHPGATEQAFLDELGRHGITPAPYHLPEWEESVGGFHKRLETLFRVSPPTALIIDEAPFFVATRHFLGRRGLGVPEDVSLICNDSDPAFSWCQPPISHIRWDSSAVVSRVIRWAGHVAHRKKDVRQTLARARFVAGGTIGPAVGA